MSGGLYGRRYKLQVQLPAAGGNAGEMEVLTVADSENFGAETLRITFDVYTPCGHNADYWWASIVIYNFDLATTKRLFAVGGGVTQGMTCTLTAGYQSPGNYDVIWTGPVFQVLLSRENVVDFKITLHCILNLSSAIRGDSDGIVSMKFGAGMSQAEIILNMLNSVGLHADYISPQLNKSKSSVGQSLFGTADKYLTQIAEDNNMVWFLTSRGIAVGGVTEGISTAPAIQYTPSTGLVFTPQQTQAGVDFTVLLDPRVKSQMPLMTVAIDETIVQQYKRQIGDQTGFHPLDQNGVYIVGAVRHRGDSRGEAWYTDITGYVPAVAFPTGANPNR